MEVSVYTETHMALVTPALLVVEKYEGEKELCSSESMAK